MSDDRYRPHIQNANEARQKASQLQFFYDKEKLQKENRYRVKGQAFPKTINGTNWGAFFLTPIWGLCNNTPIAAVWFILILVPTVGPVMAFAFSVYCAMKGNEWVWENNNWQSIEEMHYVQRKWAIAGIIFEIVSLVVIFVLFMHGLNSLQKSIGF